MRLILHEKTGRFSLSFLSWVDGTYKSYFFDRDPRTSGLIIMIDGKPYRLGDSSSFTLRTEGGDDEAAFIWTGPSLELRQEFSFRPAGDENQPDSLEIRLRLLNTGDTESRIRVWYLLDTQLGESSGVHFFTPLRDRVSGETQILPSAEEDYLAAGNPRDAVVLRIRLLGERVTVPDEAILANWKRLSDSPGPYGVNPLRSFHLMPYSINDSAVGLYYPEEPLQPGQIREIVSLLGNWSEDDLYQPIQSESAFIPEEAANAPGALAGPVTEKLRDEPERPAGEDPAGDIFKEESPIRREDGLGDQGRADPADLLKQDLGRIEEVLDSLDRQISSPEDLSEEELLRLGQILEELEQSRSIYE